MIGIDFETYSEAGFQLDPITGRWGKLPGAAQAGISRVGAAVYSEHPSTVVLMIAYDDPHNPGTIRQWRSGDPPPVDLFAYVAAGGLIRAANSMFEFLIWQNVCTARMGWPAVRLEQFRCTLAKSRAYGGPGDLAKAAQAYAVPVQKMTEGKRLIKKFSCPQNFTKTRTQQRAPLDGSPDAEMYHEYNVTDVVAEKQVDDAIPPMTPNELELWLTDQRCNARGVAIDVESVAMLSRVVELTTARLNPRVSQLTGGALNSTTELAKLGEWCASRGLVLPNMQKETIDAALDGVYGPPAPDVAEVLGIRQTLGSAAVKKLTAIEQRLCNDRRIRDILAFCGAGQTGRWAGRGPQPQNLPNSGPAVHQCDGCGAYQSPVWPSCHNCGPSTFKLVEWNPDVVDHVLTYSAERFVEAFGDGAIAAASGCLRGLFVAADGHDFICSDYSAIEAVVLAMLAGEQWRIDVFRTHGKIYEMSAAKITGIPFAEFERHKRETGDHHPMRKKVGKVSELACFAPDTQVLTDSGYVRIMEVNENHKLWDGVEWVTSYGAINKGNRNVIDLDGVKVTPEHPISLGRFWKEAKQLASNEATLLRALAIGSENLPSCATQKGAIRTVRKLSARAGSGLILSVIQTCISGSLHGALNAAVKKAARLMSRNILNMRKSCLTTSIGGVCATDFPQRSAGATTQTLAGLKITEGAGLQSATSGGNQSDRFSSTYKHSTGGTTHLSTWTVSIPTGIMSRVILGLSRVLQIVKTNDPSSNCRRGSMNSSVVYDIVNAGPRHRFTIKTDSGHLIVHNSGYQGGLGAWKNFGADKFMTDDEIRDNVKKWRAESPAIVDLWYGCERAAIAAVQSPGARYPSGDWLAYEYDGKVLRCFLPSGRAIHYHKPFLRDEPVPWGGTKPKLYFWGVDPDTKAWGVRDTYGGKLVENATQAVARDIMANALVNLERAGYPPTIHIHDEAVAEVPKGFGSIEEFEQIMATLPKWAEGWPIRAAGGWRGRRYRKD